MKKVLNIFQQSMNKLRLYKQVKALTSLNFLASDGTTITKYLQIYNYHIEIQICYFPRTILG